MMTKVDSKVKFHFSLGLEEKHNRNLPQLAGNDNSRKLLLPEVC